jgi:acetyl esterase/lipase
MKTTLFLVLFFATFPIYSSASNETHAIATVVDGIEIPIVVHTPETGDGPFPVVFHVHGGGWNGGSETEVPSANVGQDARQLGDRLGIIYVGLAYRCKNQNGAFQKAINDLHASVNWFKERADQFNADVSRIGFSGGSAGTPLSALMAQQEPNCRTYLGCWGVYDITNNQESLFPDEVARARYGLSSEEQALEASAFHNLRNPPPATLLLHGEKDVLTHHTQSLRFAKEIKAHGGTAEVAIFPEVNHNFLNPNNPEAFKKGILTIAEFYVQEFELKVGNFDQLTKDLDDMLSRYFPMPSISDEQLRGVWKGKTESIALLADGQARIEGRRREVTDAQYQNHGSNFELTTGSSSRIFYLRKDERAIYEISLDGRSAGKKTIYSKKK